MENKTELLEIESILGDKKDENYDIAFTGFLKVCFEILEDQADMSEIEIKTKSKIREFAEKRYMIFVKTRQRFGSKISLRKIGDALGGRNHATVLNGIKCHNNLMETNKYYRKRYLVFSNEVDKRFQDIMNLNQAIEFLEHIQASEKIISFEDLIETLIKEALASHFITLGNLKKRIEIERVKNGQK